MIKIFDQNKIIQCHNCKHPILTNKITIFNNKIYHQYCYSKIHDVY